MPLNRRECLVGMAALSVTTPGLAAAGTPRTVGGVRRFDPALDAVIDANAPIEVLGEGYQWAEGPVWLRKQGWLLFTDVPGNTIWRWRPGRGTDVFMRPSGLAGPVPAAFNEAGANGLAVDSAGRLVMADSGNRAIASVDLATRRKTILADRFAGKRFNSPNTVVVARNGAIYFTDPPYGLKDPDRSPLRELDFQGVYRLDPDGRVHLLEGDHRRPNGIALSPDERTLYLALSDETRPELLAYPLDATGRTGKVRLVHDMRAHLAAGAPGLPDGVAVDRAGRIFATGPGGVHVLTADGQLLGIVSTGQAIANLCFGGRDGRTLFLASHDMVASVRTRTRA
ncbi:SMP-30/gluconolactonase/LRE family protein [Sphingomonas radiodurans]|uniref:SMP-30/gluconolactonase/LRE family protein n=1 Tax=Sphingomonas radiodurans TaxID=2890321 RepID=UPI001E4AB695|nr:SMP-30/gluconolactonase/LRE family protein [Sphingomonas radiodurans]WBH18326.1 SMP-30/gluconolactonase/LRE family protein [Sphingomonas radiodurans]